MSLACDLPLLIATLSGFLLFQGVAQWNKETKLSPKKGGM